MGSLVGVLMWGWGINGNVDLNGEGGLMGVLSLMAVGMRVGFLFRMIS